MTASADERPPIEYEDFQIEFIPDLESGWYRVRATSGSRVATSREPFALGPEAIAELAPHAELAVYGKSVDGTRASRMVGFDEPPEEVPSIDQAGAELHRALIDGPIRDLFRDRSREAGPLRIRIRLDLEEPGQRTLSRLPWESLRDPDGGALDFLAVSPTTPVVRDLLAGEALTPTPIEGRLRVLVLTANPPGTSRLPGLREEGDVIAASFAELQENGALEYDHIADASLEAINEHLRERSDYHVLHFMGHGDYEDGRGLLYLHGRDAEGNDVADPVGSAELALQLKGRCDALRLVFLNACNTARDVAEHGASEHGAAGLETERRGAGVASSILGAGIPAVIAMQYEMQDRGAVTFARTFYRRLAAFRSLEEAVSDARKDVLTGEGGTRRTTSFWLTPVLYGSGVPFEMGRAVGLGPPEGVDPEADHQVWLTEHGGRLVLNWRVRAKPGYGDKIAIFDGEPEDPYGYVGTEYARASEDGRPVEQTRVYETGVQSERGRYWAAYIRDTPSGPEIVPDATYGPY